MKKENRKNQLVVCARKERFALLGDIRILYKNWILRERLSHFIITNQSKNVEQQKNWIKDLTKKRKLNLEEKLNWDHVFKQQ